MANSCSHRSQHHKRFSHYVSSKTRGTTGLNDAADPGVLAEAGDTPGPLGIGRDHSESIASSRSHDGHRHGRRPLLLEPGSRHHQRRGVTPTGRRDGNALPDSVPATPASAPQTIVLPPQVCSQLEELWEHSFVDRNKARAVQEMAATLVKDNKSGQLLVVNRHAGSSGSSEPDRDIAPGQELVGTSHTHPTLTGASVSFDAADAASLVNSADRIKIIQSQKRQFMYMRTQAAPPRVSVTELKRQFDETTGRFRKEFGVSFTKAMEAEAWALAEQCGLAYYAGEKGTFQRVYPPLASH